MSVVRRAACDRCHGLKMRCVREPSRRECNRCVNAHASCIFSIARKAGRPPSSHPTRTSASSYCQPRRHDSITNASRDEFDPDSFCGSDAASNDDLFGVSLADNLNVLEDSTEHFNNTASFSDPNSDATTLWANNYMVGDDAEQHQHVEPQAAVSAMQLLSDLSGKLFTEFHTPESFRNGEEQVVRLESLTANVIQSSVAFIGILSNTTSPISSDTATVLQIMTAYLRLTELHLALYQHMQSILIPTTANLSPHAWGLSPTTLLSPPVSIPPAPTIFPSLQIGGISLSNYPNFQLKFVLQICVHHLGEIEGLLGLPADFCIREDCGRNQAGRGGGFLEQDARGAALLIRTVMMEAGETVNGIRRVLGELREELKGSIQV
ncbi:hypothetical protein K505DRAFT_326405 [Melanomma pulvis-pyrius CBS 109.77]|uniref:Zn(2)-C6 fungal-type domain-containing protein n=1 Tax=Melanomma pulvis-pyrius CBS 109.77 TaxID=1314802 RepID=A0A6A6X852_9PLEO|nr:hypothetical protein K505DRAFT_326405 [Melanomma pulvis-pyrius CBS 109.77]